jgi:hypothetical protein
MSWKKHFTPVKIDNTGGSMSPLSSRGRPGPAKQTIQVICLMFMQALQIVLKNICNMILWIWIQKLTQL